MRDLNRLADSDSDSDSDSDDAVLVESERTPHEPPTAPQEPPKTPQEQPTEEEESTEEDEEHVLFIAGQDAPVITGPDTMLMKADDDEAAEITFKINDWCTIVGVTDAQVPPVRSMERRQPSIMPLVPPRHQQCIPQGNPKSMLSPLG